MLKESDDPQKNPVALKIFVCVVSDVPQPLGEKGGVIYCGLVASGREKAIIEV